MRRYKVTMAGYADASTVTVVEVPDDESAPYRLDGDMHIGEHVFAGDDFVSAELVGEPTITPPTADDVSRSQTAQIADAYAALDRAGVAHGITVNSSYPTTLATRIGWLAKERDELRRKVDEAAAILKPQPRIFDFGTIGWRAVIVAILTLLLTTQAQAADFGGLGSHVSDTQRACATSSQGLAYYSVSGPEDITELARTPKDKYAMRDCVIVDGRIYAYGGNVGQAGAGVYTFEYQAGELVQIGSRVLVSGLAQGTASLAIDGNAILAVGAGSVGEVVRISATGVQRSTRPVPVHAVARTATTLAILTGAFNSTATVELLNPTTLATLATVTLPDSSTGGTPYLAGEGSRLAAFARFAYPIEGASVGASSNQVNVAMLPFGNSLFASTTTGMVEAQWPSFTGTGLNSPNTKDLSIALGRLWASDNTSGFRFVKRLTTIPPTAIPTSTPIPATATAIPPTATKSPTPPTSRGVHCTVTDGPNGSFAMACVPEVP